MQTSEDLAKRANDLIDTLPQLERAQWKSSPMTKAMKLVAQSCMLSIQEAMAQGAYSTETTEGTAMKYAEAVGQYGTWEDILDFILEADKMIEETDD